MWNMAFPAVLCKKWCPWSSQFPQESDSNAVILKSFLLVTHKQEIAFQYHITWKQAEDNSVAFAVRADAPGVPEDAQTVHAQWQHRSRGSSEGKGLCFRPVHVQKVHLLYGMVFFPLLKKGVGEREPALTEIQLKTPCHYLHFAFDSEVV